MLYVQRTKREGEFALAGDGLRGAGEGSMRADDDSHDEREDQNEGDEQKLEAPGLCVSASGVWVIHCSSSPPSRTEASDEDDESLARSR